MNKITSKLRGNRFIPSDKEELSALELIKKVVDKVNDGINKINDYDVNIKDNNNKVNNFDKKIEKYIKLVDELPKTNAVAEVVEARKGEKTLGGKISTIDEQLYNNTYVVATELELKDKLKGYTNNINITLPQGKDFIVTDLEITTNNVVINGGNVKGNIVINSLDNNYSNIVFNNVTFYNDVIIKKGRGIRFEKCTFIDTDKSIYVIPPIDGLFHSISMVYVTNSHFKDVNYAMNIDKNIDSDVTYQVNDFVFTSNIINRAFIKHIYAEEIDGFIIANNTMFFPSHTEKNEIKENNIHIKKSSWTLIENNNLFEAGYESILLENAKHSTVSSNNIAWAGQRKPSSAITIKSDTNDFLHFNINGNNISKATKHGVEMVNCKSGNCKENLIELSLENDVFYYGSIDLSSIEHYGSFIDNIESLESSFIFFDNSCLNSKECNKDKNLNFEYKKKDITDISTSIITTGIEQFNLVQPSPTTITEFVGGVNGKKLTFIAFNNNTTIKYNSSKIVLKNGVDAILKTGNTLVFEYYSGKWYELSRNFENSDIYLTQDITDTSTTIVSGNVKQFNLVQPSPTTITSISGGSNGKEIMLLAFNGNTTLQNSTNLKLKGNVDVTLNLNNIIIFIYYAGKWYEKSRNF